MSEGNMARDLFLFGKSAATAPAKEQPDPVIELIERVRTGDEEAFADLYKKYGPMVHGVVLARVPKDEVQDIVQDVFLAAYKNLHSLRDNRMFGAWLVKIARNRAAEFYRSKRPTEELSDEIRGGDNRMNEAAEILRAIRSLSDSYSETLVMRLVEGMTAKEIAERTGLKPESVRVNLHRGMEQLRERLGIEGKKR
jgi:RNA polymerase sigma-70 factor (ECF subfamily)